jgi:hypothetical protein
MQSFLIIFMSINCKAIIKKILLADLQNYNKKIYCFIYINTSIINKLFFKKNNKKIYCFIYINTSIINKLFFKKIIILLLYLLIY